MLSRAGIEERRQLEKEARERQSAAGGDRKSEGYKKSLSAPEPVSESSKAVARKIAEKAGHISKNMLFEPSGQMAIRSMRHHIQPARSHLFFFLSRGHHFEGGGPGGDLPGLKISNLL